MFRKAIKADRYGSAPMVSEPLNMFDAAPLADGAAALILARADADLPDFPNPPVRLLASALATSALAPHDQPDLLAFPAAEESTRRALAQANVELEDIDLFELHDRFSIFSALSLEAAGFAARGEGWQLAQNGGIQRQGRIPITTLGGSKARGEVGGATGVYQVAELVQQLRGELGEAQVPDARLGMAQCLGGAGSTAATHILSRM
jgi:acetyl-CoA C-acetyltransferase